MKVADQIVVLDATGQVTFQGPPEGVSVDAVTVLEGNSQMQQASGNTKEAQPSEASRLAEKAAQARQTGDFQVYKYYFASLGRLSFILFATSIVCSGSLQTMQCEFLPFAFGTIGVVSR